jgi:hypothetical protein
LAITRRDIHVWKVRGVLSVDLIASFGHSTQVLFGSSFAKALRRDLLRAGVKRHDCTRPSDALAVKMREACCPNMVHDPIFSDTATTLCVDFHSFRRAFSTAETGVNAQTAMRLASHADEKTHMRYVMRTAAMRRIPESVVPKVLALALHS